MRSLVRTVVSAFCLALASSASAQEWPARPIRFVVPWPAGGLKDSLARVINDRVSKALGQTVVNDSRPGAGGRIGVAEVARAAPDGYTIGMGNLGPLTIFPNLYKNMPYDVQRDLVPITMFAASPLVLVRTPGAPANRSRGSRGKTSRCLASTRRWRESPRKSTRDAAST